MIRILHIAQRSFRKKSIMYPNPKTSLQSTTDTASSLINVVLFLIHKNIAAFSHRNWQLVAQTQWHNRKPQTGTNFAWLGKCTPESVPIWSHLKCSWIDRKYIQVQKSGCNDEKAWWEWWGNIGVAGHRFRGRDSKIPKQLLLWKKFRSVELTGRFWGAPEPAC